MYRTNVHGLKDVRAKFDYSVDPDVLNATEAIFAPAKVVSFRKIAKRFFRCTPYFFHSTL